MSIQNREHTLPQISQKDTGNCDTFASYSSGYLSQDSFVDLTNKQDTPLPNGRADVHGYSGKTIETSNDISRNANKFQKNAIDDIPSEKSHLKEIIRPSHEEELSQEVVLPDSLSNEDEPMVLITKPCLPPGAKSKENSTKTMLSSSKTVTELMHHLSLKRDKKNGIGKIENKRNAGFDGFSHLERGSNLPHSPTEEPDDCKGMKHSHSCQSMPSVSEDNNPKKISLGSNAGGLKCNKNIIDNDTKLIEDPTNIMSKMGESKDIKTVTELLLETLDSNGDELKNEEDTTKCASKKSDNSSCKENTFETNVISDVSNAENVCLKDNAIVDAIKSTDIRKSLKEETLQQKRNREQKMLSQKLDEFRKNSRSTKADHIRICSDRQMRAKSEDIIVKPFIGKSKKVGGKESNQDPEKLLSKRHSSTFGQNSRQSSINKTSLKQEKLKRQSLDDLDKNRRRLASDSDICYSASDKVEEESCKGAKTKKLSLMEFGKSANGKDSMARKYITHKLSAPHLIQSVAPNTGTTQEKEVKKDKKVDAEKESKSLGKKSNKSSILPSPPVEFKDLPLTNSMNKDLPKMKDDEKPRQNQTAGSNLQLENNERVKAKFLPAIDVAERLDSLAKSNLLRQSKLEKMKKEIPEISVNSPKAEHKKESRSHGKQTGSHSLDSDLSEIKRDIKSRKNNMFSNCQTLTSMNNHFSKEDDSVQLETNTNITISGGSNDNQLFVVDRRDSTVDCMESTPLPSPNLSEKSKINFSNLYTKNNFETKPSSKRLCASNRLGVKRYLSFYFILYFYLFENIIRYRTMIILFNQ